MQVYIIQMILASIYFLIIFMISFYLIGMNVGTDPNHPGALDLLIAIAQLVLYVPFSIWNCLLTYLQYAYLRDKQLYLERKTMSMEGLRIEGID
ncbi:unnamed protein product, partial [Mesorhabditis belari]|uniref:Transmembrane protein n=1 Tax=Mesorhabditis belari TaxID=2138241 RepID=A0AAF3FDW2_9BILA